MENVHIRFVLQLFVTTAILLLGRLEAIAQVDAFDDDTMVFENEDTTGNVAENDLLPTGQNAIFTVIQGPQQGTFSFTSGGNYIYSPPLNDFGFIDSVYYQVCVNGVCDIAGIGFYVIFRNTQPFANDDFFSVEINAPRTADVTRNDGDPDSVTDPLSTELHWFKFNNPTNGIVNSFTINGTFTYTPNAGYTGNDSFQYYVVDHCGLTEYATVFLNVVGNNLGPLATNPTFSNLDEDAPYSGSLQSFVSDPENDAISFSVVSPPSSGNLQLSSNGIFTYTPAANFTGTINFTYNACDIVGQCAQGVVTLTINNTDNDPPTLVADSLTLNEDTPVTINVSLNDSDDSPTLSYSILSQASNGVVNMASNAGTFNYTPALNYAGFDSFIIQACDGVNCTTSTVTVQVAAINDTPSATPFALAIEEDSNASGAINTFSDVESSSLVYSVIGVNTIAGLIVNSNGTFNYVAPTNYFGTQSITLQACDAQNLCASSTFTLQVNAVNDLPIVTNDSFTGSEDQSISGNLSNGEYDVEAGPLTYSSSTNATNGVLAVATNGQFTFIPNAHWFGSETMNISVCDNQNGCVSTVLTVTINSVNDTPVALPANLSTNEDTNLTGNLGAFATDIETSQLTFSLLTSPSTGQFNLSSNGAFTYMPAPNISGNTTATYQVCDASGSCANGNIFITTNPMNDAPNAPNITLTITEDQAANGSITSIQDIDNSGVVITINQNAAHGVFTINNSGNYTFLPAPNYSGNDLVTYTACDALNACSQGSIFLVIQAVEDFPVVNNETIVIIQDNILNGNLSNNDSDGDSDALLYNLSSTAANGTINVASNGSFIYAPNTGFVGTEIINYQACDPQGNCENGILTISVLTSNTAPVASNSNLTTTEDSPLMGNLFSSITDSEGGPFNFSTINLPQHGSIQWGSNGAFTYAPAANYFGNDSFMFQACDAGNLCSQATVAISITAQNDSPILLEDQLFLFEDNTIVVNISENDADIEGEAISYQLTSATSNGMASLTSSGVFSFIPNANFSGIETLTYNGCDVQGACSSGILSIWVNEISDPPVATSLSLSTSEDNTVSGNVSDYTSDVDSEIFYFGTLTNPVFGSVTMQTDGSFSYSPTSNYFGTDQFIYYAADDFGMTDTSVIYIQITSVNDAPNANDDFTETPEDFSVSFNLASNDTDPDNDNLNYSLISQPSFGTAEITATGLLTYTPSANTFGNENIEVQICDANNSCVVSIATIFINSVNDLPIVQPTEIYGAEDDILVGNLALQAADIEDTQLQFEITGIIEHGEWTLSNDGIFHFIPETNYFGIQTANFTACDSEGGCATQQITIVVNSVNDAPVAQNSNVTLSEDSAIQNSFALLVSDADGDDLSIDILQDVEHGSFVLNTNGSYAYAPTANYFGLDSLNYSVCDASGACAQGTIYFEITFLNDLPLVNNESVQVITNSNTIGSVAANDEELDFEPLIYSIVEDLSGGIFLLNPDGTYSYTPATDTSGLFSISYAACDPCNACDYGTITFFVVSQEEANTPPTANDFAGEVCQGGTLTINLSNSIFDAENANNELQLTFGTANSGSYQLDAETHELIYQAGSFTTGQVVIPYYVCDAGVISMCDTAQIVLTISPPNTITILGFSTQQISCYGAHDGEISIEAQAANGSLTYSWNNGDSSSSINQLAPGIYSLVLSSDAACPVNQTAQFEIFEPAELVGSHEIIGDELLLTIIGGTPSYSIVWNTPTGIVLNETTLPIDGEGTYTYSITDANDCQFSESIQITGITERDAFSTEVFPNPISNEGAVTIQSSAIIIELEVLDSKGLLVQHDKTNSQTIELNTSGWSSGLYLLRMHSAQGTVCRRLVKQ